MRDRTKRNISNDGSWSFTLHANGQVYTQTGFVTNGKLDDSYMQDELGKFRDHPCVHTRVWRSYTAASVSSTGPYGATLSGTYTNGGRQGEAQSYAPSLELSALDALIKQVDVRPLDFNPIVSLAESLQTIAMLKKPAAFFAQVRNGRLWKKVKHLRVKDAFKVIRGSAGAYLEYRYGWSQLCRDIRGVTHARARLQSEFARQKALREKITPLRAVVHGSFEVGDVPSVCSYLFKTGTLTQWASADVLVHPQVNGMLAYTTLMKFLSLDAFASNAWEVLPFSFVADWFLPIGKYLKRQERDIYGVPTVHMRRINVSEALDVTQTILQNGPWQPYTEVATIQFANEPVGEMRIRVYKRNVDLTPGGAYLASNWTIQRFADAAALTLTRIRS